MKTVLISVIASILTLASLAFTAAPHDLELCPGCEARTGFLAIIRDGAVNGPFTVVIDRDIEIDGECRCVSSECLPYKKCFAAMKVTVTDALGATANAQSIVNTCGALDTNRINLPNFLGIVQAECTNCAESCL